MGIQIGKWKIPPSRVGVPQGGALSPFLSLLALEKTIFKSAPAVMYADDGLFYGDNPYLDIDRLDDSDDYLLHGITFNKKKTG